VRTKRTKGKLMWNGPFNARMGGFEFWSSQENKEDFEEYVIVSLDKSKYALIRYTDGEEEYTREYLGVADTLDEAQKIVEELRCLPPS
jgi:hypothetical protein